MLENEELQRRLIVLKRRLEEGKLVIAEHLKDGFRKSFESIRYLSSGDFDPSTVDGRIRSMAMAVSMMEDRENAKASISLSDIQNAFFDRITHVFEEIYEFMRKIKSNPHNISFKLSNNDEIIEKNYKLIDPFLKDLENFWYNFFDITTYHIQDMNVIKGVFGGDLFPSYDNNIASSSGLYLDTIILTDPFMNTKNLFEKWPKKEAVRMFLKHGLQLMNYKSLAIADIKNPIVVILPFKSSLDEEYRDDLFNESGSKAILHAEKLFGRSFSSVDDLKDFLAFAHSPQTLSAMLRAPERLLFDTDWNGPLGAQLERAMKDFSLIAGNHAGEIVFNQCFGRMSQASDIAWKSSNLGGVPLIDAPTSWQYYNWRLEYAANLDTLNQVPLHVTRGMQRLAETDMHWLGNIPPEALIEMRKVGALDEVRGILCQGVEEVISLNSENFFRSADKIYENLELAFDNHKKDIDRLRAKKWKFAGSDIGSWIVAGSIEVAAAVLGTPAWGVAATVVSQITDAPKLKDIPRAIKDLRDEGQKISHSAGGLLFKHKP